MSLPRRSCAALVVGAAGCVGPLVGETPPPSCDPRVLPPGEVRAFQASCDEVLIRGSEGRPGDWVLENDVARFVIRGDYGALTAFEPGGTIVDAALLDGDDLLMEVLPAGERGDISAATGDGWSEIRAGQVVYRLEAGADWVGISTDAARLFHGVGRARAGGAIRDGTDFVALDGRPGPDAGSVELSGVTRLALSPGSAWPGGEWIDGEADADSVAVIVDGAAVDRVPVEAGAYSAWVPEGGSLLGESPGCAYDGLAKLACGSVRLRARDSTGGDVAATVTDGAASWALPSGGGRAPVGPSARTLYAWAGPAHGYASLPFPGGDVDWDVTLPRAHDGLRADLALPVYPGVGAADEAPEAIHAAAARGVRYAVLVADGNVAKVVQDAHDAVLARNGARVDGALWSWSWSPNGERAAQGAVDPEGVGALDLLARVRGGRSGNRTTVATPGWIEAARAEAHPRDWDEGPDALWLDADADVETLVGALEDWIDVAPVGPVTWLEVRGTLGTASADRAILEDATCAGNGPRVRLEQRGPRTFAIRVDAPGWMEAHAAWVRTSSGERPIALVDGSAIFEVPPGTTWVLAGVRGARAEPWSDAPAWAVAGPGWAGGP